MSSLALSFSPVDNARLNHLCGALDENLKQIEQALDVKIARRGEHFRIRGDAAEQARAALEQFYLQAKKALSIEDIQLGLLELRRMRREHDAAFSGGQNGETSAQNVSQETQNAMDAGAPVLWSRKGELRARTPRQADYLRAIFAHDITFGIGPAGTGKTYLAVACAVDAMERDAVRRLILVRPAVEAGEKLGFLPGDLTQKVDPYLRPLYDALYDLMGFERVGKLFEKNLIEVAPLAYMRGRTLNNAFIILDEAQNTTPEQMKMFLTRVGFGSKAVITGDVTQIDLARHQKSGLIEAQKILGKVGGIYFHQFQSDDVVRHPLVQKIVDAYDAWQATQFKDNAHENREEK